MFKFESMKRLFWFWIAVFAADCVMAQNNWVIQKEKDGIKISNRHAANSPFNDVRVEADLPGTVDQMAKILLDVNKYKEWAYATKKSVLVKQLGPGRLIYYTEIEVPWPATDRYLYAQFELKRDAAGNSLQLISTSIADQAPPPKDLVKVTYSRGSWNIIATSKKSIHIDYILELNPGGTLPAWVLNLFSTKGPLETFENIRESLASMNP